jgi:hypothetical protein
MLPQNHPTARTQISETLLTLRLPKKMYQSLARVRAALGVPISRIIRDALTLYLDVANYETILREHQKAGRVYTEDQVKALLENLDSRKDMPA